MFNHITVIYEIYHIIILIFYSSYFCTFSYHENKNYEERRFYAKISRIVTIHPCVRDLPHAKKN